MALDAVLTGLERLTREQRFTLAEEGRVLVGTQQTTGYTGNVGTASLRCQR